MGVKRACSDGETKGKECRLKITPTGIVNLLESIANKENNKVYLRIRDAANMLA